MGRNVVFLTLEEIMELTGYQQQSAQRQWLTRHGWYFEVSRGGRPIVGRAYAEQRLGLSSAPLPTVRKEPQLKLAAIKKKALVNSR